MSTKLPEFIDTNAYEDDGGFEPLPAGWYSARVLDSELRTSKSGNMGLNVEFEITGPTHSGRRVFNWFNLYHSKQQVAQIARGQFSTLCRSCGLGGVVDDSAMLHGREVMVRLTVRKDDQWGDSNDVRGYKAVHSSAPSPASQPWQQQAPQAPQAQPTAPAQSPPAQQQQAPQAQPVQQQADPAPAPTPAQPAPQAPALSAAPPWLK